MENEPFKRLKSDMQISIRISKAEYDELKRISPKNVSYAIKKLIREQKTNKEQLIKNQA